MEVIAVILALALGVFAILGANNIYHLISKKSPPKKKYKVILGFALIAITIGGFWGMSYIKTSSTENAVQSACKELRTELENDIKGARKEAYSEGYEVGYGRGYNTGYDHGSFAPEYGGGSFEPSSNSNVALWDSSSDIEDTFDTVPGNSAVVWVTSRGKKYHTSSNCGNMKYAHSISLEEAIDQGYGPCSKCY